MAKKTSTFSPFFVFDSKDYNTLFKNQRRQIYLWALINESNNELFSFKKYKNINYHYFFSIEIMKLIYQSLSALYYLIMLDWWKKKIHPKNYYNLIYK